MERAAQGSFPSLCCGGGRQDDVGQHLVNGMRATVAAEGSQRCLMAVGGRRRPALPCQRTGLSQTPPRSRSRPQVCCQTNAELSQCLQRDPPLGGAGLPPLSGGGRTIDCAENPEPGEVQI